MDNIIKKAKNLLGEGVRTNLYRLDIRFPFATPDIKEESHILITSTQTPAFKTGAPIKKKIMGGKEIKFPSVQRIWDNFTGTVLQDEKMVYKNAFEKWIEITSPWDSNEGKKPLEIEVDWTLSLLSVDGKTVIKKYKLYNIFPESIDAIKLSADSEDVQSFNFTVHYVGADTIN